MIRQKLIVLFLLCPSLPKLGPFFCNIDLRDCFTLLYILSAHWIIFSFQVILIVRLLKILGRNILLSLFRNFRRLFILISWGNLRIQLYQCSLRIIRMDLTHFIFPVYLFRFSWGFLRFLFRFGSFIVIIRQFFSWV